MDVYFDHFLAKDWDRYGDGTQLAEFADARYEVLSSFRDIPVERYHRLLGAMRRDNWLVGYATLAGVERALHGIAQRCKRENPIASGLPVLVGNYETLHRDFETFFPQVKAYAATLVTEQPDPQRLNLA